MLTSTLYDAMEDLYDLYIVSEDYYWRYTAVSDTLTDRVKMLAESIVEPYDNDYDRVKAIDEFFNDDFTYSLQVDDVPQNRDFVDWFLFGPREGYCTYYATAMTTMVRSIGLPARYVEGFLTPRYPEPFYRYPILNANAHAWVEVYFEGVGWITFDPTPSGSERGYNNTDDEPDRVLDDEVLDENLDELDKPDDPFVPLPPSGTTDDKGSSIPKGLLIPLIIVGALAIFNILVHILRKSLFKRVASSRKFKIGYLEILRIARLRGFKLRKGRTLMELAEMIDDAYFAAHVSMKDITSVYYKIVYNGDDTTPEELKKIELFYTDFRHELNNELKLWEWIVYRILLPIL
jgi:hypothetical protein